MQVGGCWEHWCNPVNITFTKVGQRKVDKWIKGYTWEIRH